MTHRVMTNSWYQWTAAPIARNTGIALLRIWLGVMLIMHGYGKVFGEGTGALQSAITMGFPAPEVFAWLAAISEFFGGIFLILGLGTRLWALLAACTMFVAAIINNPSGPFGRKELALIYLVGLLAIVLIGAGRFSLDYLIGRRGSTARSSEQKIR